MGRNQALTFGEWLKAKRAERRITLRAFAERSGIDPGNLSRYERGLSPPPQGDSLERICGVLQLKKGSEDWQTLQDLAAAAAGRIPPDLAADPAVVGRLPVLFRVAREKKLTRETLLKLAERIRKS